MKPQMKTTGTILTLALLTCVAPTLSQAQLCGTSETFSVPQLPTRAQWRTGITHTNQDGGATKTSASREKTIRASTNEMYTDVKGGQTPLMTTHFEPGLDWEYLVETPGYGSHIVDRVQIRGLGNTTGSNTSSVDATLVLPVSGHVGYDNAQKWAVTDTYDIVWQTQGQRQTLIKGVSSLGIVSIQEVKIPLIKGQVVSVSYYRSGSLGPAGYVEGRVIELVWDGT